MTLIDNELVRKMWKEIDDAVRSMLDRFQKQEQKCEHAHEMGGCHKILGCPPNAWDGDKPTPEPEEYTVQFNSHGDGHELSIDLECFAKALKKHL